MTGVINNKVKRNRTPNFNKEEELLLLEEITKFAKVIECKATNRISCTDKDNAWKEVLSSFNAKNLNKRTEQQIKAKYDNLKTKARKTVADQKLYIKGTGGGPCNLDSSVDAVTAAVLNIINFKTVVGLFNPFDDDNSNSSNFKINADSEVSQLCISPIISNNVEEMPQVYEAAPIAEPYIIPYIDEQIPGCSRTEVSRISPIPVSSNSLIEEVSVRSPKQNCETPIVNNWGHYNSKKLKSKIHSKLRPTVRNPAFYNKENYYKRKLELLVEEHAKKMVLLDLEIQLKQKQLSQ